MGHIHKLEQTVSMLNDVLFIAAQDNFSQVFLEENKTTLLECKDQALQAGLNILGISLEPMWQTYSWCGVQCIQES